MSVPPDMMLALQQTGGPPAPDTAEPLEPEAPEGEGGPEAEPISILKLMIDAAKAYMEVEPDEEDKATMAKVLSTLQQYLAKDQSDQAQALGNPSMQRVLRKAY